MSDSNTKTAPDQGSSSLSSNIEQSNSVVNSNFDTILSKLDNVRCTGNQCTGRCPNHDDKRNSLSCTQANDGSVLIHCHAGCAAEDILNKLNMTMRDLFPHRNKNHLGKIIATYDYVDENGKLLYQVVRFSPKDFRQRRPDGKGGWIWKVGGVTKVPYRLPDILNSSKDTPIFIVEGEKDADRLASLGLVATTNVGGAGKWTRKLNKYFAGRKVVIIPDNDKAGRDHAHKVRKELLS